FVRCLHVDEDHPAIKMPFSYTQFGAVLMVDIVGFSQMTSIASSKGDVGAEMLSSQIGAYFDIAIRIIEYHGGDVVKFLGDALLVVFQADPSSESLLSPDAILSVTGDDFDKTVVTEDNSASAARRNKITVRKAIECSQELLARLSDYRIYLSGREFSRKLSCSSSGSEGITTEDWNNSNSSFASVTNGMQGNSSSPTRNTYGPEMSGNSIDTSRYVFHSNAFINSNSSLELSTGSSSRRSSLNDANIPHHDNNEPKPRKAIKNPHAYALNSPIGNDMSSVWNVDGTGFGVIPSLHITTPSTLNSELNITAPATKPATGNTNDSTPQRQRENSVTSTSTKTGSTASKSRTRFFSKAFSLITHSHNGDRRGSCDTNGTLSEGGTLPNDTFHLQLHMALSAGDISNIIIGEIGGDHGVDDLLVQNTGRLEYAICGEQMATIEDALSLAHAGEITLTQSVWNYVNPESYPKGEPRENCVILKSQDFPSDANFPLMRRVRNEKLLNTPVISNPHYYKYLNRSAIHRLILHPDGAFPAQFRNATILFVSLGDASPWTREGLTLCQKAIQIVQRIISTYEGFIQQFAVDDKGATLLCAFGLPYPRSHENEAIFAAKTAWLIQQELLRKDILGFKISLATGVIFTSSIGNEFRRDPAIVGDTIVIAVRILKFEYAKESIVCDDSTMLACTADHDGLCEFEYMGEEYVKGKSHPTPNLAQQIHRPDDIMIDETIGYGLERDKVSNFIDSWSQNPQKNTLLVTGPRGSGKCLFYQQISRIAEDHGYVVCSARTAEVEQITEHFPIRFLLLSFFDIMLRKIPHASKTTSRSTSSIMSTNWGDRKDISASLSNMTLSTDSSAYSSEPRSPGICQYGETFESSQTKLTKLQALISVCLDKMGDKGSEQPLPELDRIISAISSENSAFIMKPEDDYILTTFIISILNYASQFLKIIVILEDTQWSDFKTLNILNAIHGNCPSVLIVLFSRPQRDYGSSNILETITGHPYHLEIKLEGLKRWEIEQALLRAFKPNGVNRISPEIMELVMEQTKGNPKFVKNMSLMLQEFCHVNIVDGELLTTGKSANPSTPSKAMEEMLLKQDRKKVTLMQYDRIRPKFQDFLKIASCLGEQFSLAEVAAIKPLESLLGTLDHKDSYAGAINELDTFKFLSLATEQQTNIQFSTNVILQRIYIFRSLSTAHDIYDSIPYEERVGYHLKMAQFYESFLEQAQSEDPTDQPLNCQDLLPQISHHYLKTDVTVKKIKYLKALAAFHLKSNMLTDSTDNINELIKILDTEHAAKDLISQEDLADIYGMKGESLSKRMRIEEAESALMDSLAKYGVVWPTTKSQCKRELMKESLKFKYYYRRGIIPVVQKPGRKLCIFKGDLKTYVRLSRIIRVLSCIQNIYYWVTDPDAAMLSCLYTLKYSRKLGLPSGDQTVSLARIAILHYYHGNKNECERYMNDARHRNEAGETTGGMLEAIQAYMEYNEGRQASAHRLLDQAISESKTFGVVTHLATFYQAVTQKAAYRMWEGAFNAHQDDWQLLRTLSAVALQNGDSEGETLFAIPTVANMLIQNRLREAESWVSLIERFILPKARLMNLIIVFGILSFYYAKKRNFQKSRIYIELHSQKIAEQISGAHPFPLLSCMFSLIAMYEIHNTAYYALGGSLPPSTAPINQSRGDVILHRIINYLQTDPLRLVANPLICLAESMRCFIVPSQRREGAVKLARGYQNLSSSMDSIEFMKAYYLSQLGRHSGTELKHEYHMQAHRLFLSMAMEPAIWLLDPVPSRQSPQIDGGQVYTASENTPASFVSSVLGEDVEGGEARHSMDSGDSKTSVAPLAPPPTIKIPTIGKAKTQDEIIGVDMKLSSNIELDDGSFDTELATASVTTAPIVYNMQKIPDHSDISVQGTVTQA
ncbi:hypothetical protein BGX27_001317, partial [Mortierella sp. AM989]